MECRDNHQQLGLIDSHLVLGLALIIEVEVIIIEQLLTLIKGLRKMLLNHYLINQRSNSKRQVDNNNHQYTIDYMETKTPHPLKTDNHNYNRNTMKRKSMMKTTQLT